MAMASSVFLRKIATERNDFEAHYTIGEDGVKQRRVRSGMGNRFKSRCSTGSRIGRNEKEENTPRANQRRQIFNPWNGIQKMQDAAADVSRAINDSRNPSTLEVSPSATSSVGQQSAVPAQSASRSFIVSPQPTPQSQPNRPSLPTTQMNIITPSATSTGSLSTLISAPSAVAMTQQPQLTNPAFLTPIADAALNDALGIDSTDPSLASFLAAGSDNGVLATSLSGSADATTTLKSAPDALATGIQLDASGRPEPEGEISQLVEGLIIGAGVICFIVLLLLAILIFLKKRRGEKLSIFVRRKPTGEPTPAADRLKNQARARSYIEPPPRYDLKSEDYDYANEDKKLPFDTQVESFYIPGPPPPLTIPNQTLPVSESYSATPEVKPPRLDMPSSYGRASQSQDLYGVSPQSARPLENRCKEGYRQNKGPQRPPPVSRFNSNTSTYNNIVSPSNYSDNFSPSTQLTGGFSNSYSNTGTQNTFNTSVTSNLHYTSQQENNRVSNLSSLSSGFGDGVIIVQDNGSVQYTSSHQQQQQRKSRGQRLTRFSWQTAASRAPVNDRTSTFTTTSIDTAPRFRSVNSWVAQQSGRVQREQMMAAQIPEMPKVPVTLQKSVAAIKQHQRQESDISAFNYHPGQEIAMTPGSRIASSVLDRNIGHMSRSTLG